ncbi:MAG: tetratricopeptide repeat protein [Bacteroidia bacterium]|nr:tetratricopeptide repeat protein [Bacteroidia bacterium]
MSTTKRKRGFQIVLGALAGLVLFSCTGNKNQGNDHQNRHLADSLSQVADTTSLEARLERVNHQLEFGKDNYSLYYDRALIYYQMGNTAQALIDIDKSLDLNDQAPESWHLKGYFAYVQNDNELAQKLFKESARMGSDNPETFYTLGQIQFFKADYPEAEKYYNTAIELDPGDPTYYFAKGFLYESQGKNKKAEELYNLALEKDSSFVKALAQLHDMYLNVYKDAGRASLFNDRILAISPGHPVGHFNEGNMFFRMANAVTDSTQKLEFESTLRMAVSEYSRAIQNDPDFTKALYNRGYCFFLLDKYDEALTDFKKVIELDPANEKAHFMSGSINEYFGDYQTALASYEKAAKLDPAFEDAVSAVEDMRARLGVRK